jgi:hypothetical protein
MPDNSNTPAFGSSPLTTLNGHNGAAASFSSGTIIDYNYEWGTYNVKLDNNRPVTAIAASSLISGLLGIKVNAILEAGTPVICVTTTTTGETFILGTLGTGGVPSSQITSSYITAEPTSNVISTLFDPEKANNAGANSYLDGSMPMNLAPGDVNIQAGGGSAITLLQTLASLKASELAKIECFVQDDMVRILNKTFQHISAFGDYNIYNENGSLNVEWKGTSEEFESFGGSSKGNLGLGAEAEGQVTGLTDLPSFNSDGKWRFVNYIGKIGNFIHMFVTDPKAALKQKDEGEEPASGRFGLHVNEDGSFLCQSVSDIVLEKVVKIPVARAKNRWEETPADKEFDPKYMKNWVPMGDEKLWQMSYKLRDYAKWFSEGYCNSGFLGNDRFIKPSCSATEDPSTWAENAEREKVDGAFENVFGETQEAYATIRIFKDGSIVLMDAYGSSVHLTGGNVQIAASKNLLLNAANTVNIMGKEVNITSIDSTTIASTQGSMDIAGNTLARLSSTNGFTILESSMQNRDAVDIAMVKDQRFKELIDQTKLFKDDTNVASVIVSTSKADSKFSNILLASSSGLYLRTKTAFLSAANYIANVGSFFIPGFIKFLKGSYTLFDGANVTFKSIVNGLMGFATKFQLPINTALGPESNSQNSAVLYQEDMKEPEANITDLLGNKLSENCLKDTTPVNISKFKFKEYKEDPKNPLMQSLTDQYLAVTEGSLIGSEVESASTYLTMGTSGQPWPGKNKTMKYYDPTVVWDANEATFKSKDGYTLTNKSLRSMQYDTYVKKDEE